MTHDHIASIFRIATGMAFGMMLGVVLLLSALFG
jgi:hypothetical protein